MPQIAARCDRGLINEIPLGLYPEAESIPTVQILPYQ